MIQSEVKPNGVVGYEYDYDQEAQKYFVRNENGRKVKGKEFVTAVAAQEWIDGRKAKPVEPKAAPPVTFPLPPEIWRQFILEGMERLYGAKLTDTTGRFQDDYLMMSGQPVTK